MYKIHKAQFMLCAAWKSQWPENDLPEICLAGRSNVGKSSFINTITNHSKLSFMNFIHCFPPFYYFLFLFSYSSYHNSNKITIRKNIYSS